MLDVANYGDTKERNYASRNLCESEHAHRTESRNELAELQEYASPRGWEIVGEYVDSISGSKE
jgi:hypothetical protein